MSVVSALMGMGRIDSIQQALGVKDITSAAMREAILRWNALYYDKDSPAKEEDDCQRLAVVIVNKLVKTTFAEYTVHDDKKAADALLMEINRIKAKAMQHCFVGGECLIKPVPMGDRMQLRVMRRDCYTPLARDADGRITDVASTEQTTQGNSYYTLLERRTAMPDGNLQIITKLYRSSDTTYLGSEVPLNTLPQYELLQPVIMLPGADGIGLVHLKTPLSNTVDGSDDGVAIYAPAAGLIRNIDHNEWQMGREFELGRSRIVVPDDMLEGKSLKDDVFAAVEGDPNDIGVTVFSPVLREQSYLARKNEYLRNVESLIGLKRGILSEVEAAERTATEITSSAGDYSLTIIDLQNVWEAALRELIGLCIKLGKIYKVGGYDKLDPSSIIVEWGNGVLYDENKENDRRLAQVQAGLLAPERYLGWYYNLPCETPEDREQIRKDYMPEIADLLGGE